MSNFQTIKVQRREPGIVEIELDRPEAAHGINVELGTELAEIARELEIDPSVRAVVLTADGKLFCGGGDINEMCSADDAGRVVKQMADGLHRAVVSFANMRAPLIVAVNGTAAGAGLSLVLGADYTISVDRAKFTSAYTKIGLSPDGGATYFLPRLIGVRKAYEFIMTNPVLSAQQALEWGMINEVVSAEELSARAAAVAEELAVGSIDSADAVKQLLRNSFGNGLEQQLELESRYIARNANSANGKEGVTAFTEKRAPKFS